ncbi:hypothetical protein A2774_03815 [Candidatus Roizmanbacteria bacterium RIFCSPHIGHO2_01_FULL_39_12c]|uniref:Glycosyl transferase family 1 domain-containing protein n=1 Tax=Candidatus Roizmanbacteria bacterium RIFCSPHIGHO2_01_FULL_39_12c TaxID=1802031 RepID=A0A1F7GFN3_9BACT|nr:MAG: hypothetical protein A2774_03815 [Candidatus Roizmanbacteria bacterium RIFCSPHIGHO2_01_FULL_39_12c]OGK47967.1 MAG: hypothetical protein A2963_00035 [Candidatus Roizmanbacteria bacterium RIFCSPLOWO2_01_FULL_40_13]
MIIAVDGNEANVKEKVGVSVYTFKLLQYFHKKADKNLRFLVFLKYNPASDLPLETDFYKYSVIRGDFLWSQTFLPLDLYKRKALGQKIDIFFSPAHYIPRLTPIPTIVTIHDLSFFYYPQEFLKKDLFKLKNWTRRAVEKAKKIIAVSNTTKKDIVRFYDVEEEKIEVILNGYEKKIKNQKSKIKSIDKKYILFVGTLQPRKNLDTLIDAFTLFRQNNPEFKLIIAGKKGWLYDYIFKKVEGLKLKKDVIFKGFVSDQELTVLYQNAFCFVLPSLYEGFGIPVLEAMSFGCPVISSFASSLPEVGGEACLYFDPKDPLELKEKLTLLAENRKLRSDLIKKGGQRIRLFSWQKCAKSTLDLLSNQANSDLTG